MVTKTPNPRTTKSKPKRKPREWRIVVAGNSILRVPVIASTYEIYYQERIKVREVIK